MPQLPWWGYILVKIAINFGFPALIKAFPGVPQWVIDVVNDLLDKLKDPNESNSRAKKEAIFRICSGIGRPPETKKD